MTGGAQSMFRAVTPPLRHYNGGYLSFILRLSKPPEWTTARVNPDVNYGLWGGDAVPTWLHLWLQNAPFW